MLSIIIPTYNEENAILDLLSHLDTYSSAEDEILVVDGGSTDQTVNLVQNAGINCVVNPDRGRAAQMNKGAELAHGDVFYFVHADTLPPPSFSDDIRQALKSGYTAGCYRYSFDTAHPLLKINAYCTRFDRLMCRGGDQTLFITRDLFNHLGGFRSDFMVMEDYDLIRKIQANSRFRIIPKNATVSSRKYEHNGYFQVNFANLIIFLMYFCGCRQETMVHAYKNLIFHPKFD